MKNKRGLTFCIGAALLLAALTLFWFSGTVVEADTAPDTVVWAVPTAISDFTTVITVDSAADPDDSGSKSCYLDESTLQPASPCTLRRALVEAEYIASYKAVSLPIQIRFDIPTTDPQYDSAGGYWTIQITETGQHEVLSGRIGDSTVVDASTQPDYGGNRADKPRILIRGPEENIPEGIGMIVDGDGSVIRGFGLRRLRQYIQVNGNNNVIEDNWIGFTPDGKEVALNTPDAPEDGCGQSGIKTADNTIGNVVQNNVMAGLRGGAINIGGGDGSYVLSNTIGTRADGTVPEVRLNRKCMPNARYYNWFAGYGIQIFGDNHLVENNRVIGMRNYSADPFSSPDSAIAVTGEGVIVRNNIIGQDAAGQSFGVCGEGIAVGGSSGAHDIQVLNNTIVNSWGQAGLFMAGGPYGYDYNGVTVQGNIVKEGRYKVFAFSQTLPDTLREFNPAAVTSIDGTSVSGTSGADSPCANCTVELFLDEVDMVEETLESLAVVTADGSGNWTATLPRTLNLDEGIRTASTTATDGQITHPNGDYTAGTTVKLSELYVQTGAPSPTAIPTPTLESPLAIPDIDFMTQPTAPTGFNTVITVDSASDPDGDQDKTCSLTTGTKTPATPCTLRRALIEAGTIASYYPVSLPVQIRFDIPTADAQYDSAGGYWVIQLYQSTQLDALPHMGGSTVLDGSTQPDYGGNRADKPRIIVRGPENVPEGYGIVVDGDNSVIRGLAFQRLRMHLHLSGDSTIVEDSWFGLTADGQEIYLNDTAHPEDGSGQSGIRSANNSSNNLIQNNVLAGSTGGAINQEGDDGYILNNYVGTRADGTINAGSIAVDDICEPNAANNWFGGGGIKVSGLRNQVNDNVVLGLLIQGSVASTQDSGIEISGGWDNVVQNNRVGRDATGADVWTCGPGISVKARFNRVLSNTVVSSWQPGIYLDETHPKIDGNMMQNNILSNTIGAIVFGASVPSYLSEFVPARVMGIDGTSVIGTSGSACPYCRVELYLDDDDQWVETLEYLGATKADANGNWSFTLPARLAQGQGLRTMSMARNYGVVPYFESGATTKLSMLYSPPEVIKVISTDGGTVSHIGGRGTTEVNIPAGAFGTDATVTFKQVITPEQELGELKFAGQSFDLEATADLVEGNAVDITMEYDEDDLAAAGITDESVLAIYYWDENKSQWDDVANTCSPASEYNRDAAQNTLSVEVCHLSSFGLFGISGYEIYLPVVMKSYGS